VITLYHWTHPNAVDAILDQGFRDTTYREPTGVHLSNHPTYYRADSSDAVIVVQLPDDLDLGQYLDPVQLGLPEMRDYIIPAAVLNEQATFITT
jgi:hypothetical protein